jgi:glutamate 5-kinase
MAGGAGTKVGTGGMATKIAAAKIATKAGCAMCIMNSNDLSKIYDLLDGKQVGTLFLPSKEA